MSKMSGFCHFSPQQTKLQNNFAKMTKHLLNIMDESTQGLNENFRMHYRELSRGGASERELKQSYEKFQHELKKKGEKPLTAWFFFDSHFDHTYKLKKLRDRRRKHKEEEEDMEIWKSDTLSLFNLTDREFSELDYCACKRPKCFTCCDYAIDERRRQKMRDQGFVFNGEFHFENFNDDLTITAVRKEEE